MKRRIRIEEGTVETEVVEDDRRRLKNGTVEVRGHWVARVLARSGRRRPHERKRPHRAG